MQASFFEYLKKGNFCELLLCENEKEADALSQVSAFFEIKTFVLPDFRAEFGDDLRAFSKELFELCRVLNAYHKENSKKILISPLASVLKKLPSKRHLRGFILDKKERRERKK